MRFITGAIGAVVICLVGAGTSASASSIDLSTWTCAKIQAADNVDINIEPRERQPNAFF